MSNRSKACGVCVPFPAALSRGALFTQRRKMVETRYGFACGLLTAVIWGGYLAMTRYGIGAGLTAPDLAFLRYTTAGLVLLPWLLRHQPFRLAGMGWSKGAMLALLAGPPFVLVGASGFDFAPLAHSAVIQLGAVTLMGIALSILLIGDTANRRRLIGVGVIITGLSVTAGPSLFDGGSTTWIGDLFFAAAGTMWALFTVLQRRWGINPMAGTAVVSVLSGILYAPAYIAWRGLSNLTTISPLILFQQVIVLGLLAGVVALFAFGRAVEYLGPARASLFPALAPAIAMLVGIPLADEIPTLLQVTGLVILSAGLLIAIRTPDAPSAVKSGER
jgi:drug/metabolite transporter (DMT)-like permease